MRPALSIVAVVVMLILSWPIIKLIVGIALCRLHWYCP